ncbi:3-hydroxyacyl-CoA dehydrogenase [Streptomyces sp. 604F]|uniref:3-hydroxyacyl-CoA dehydrogenase n=1 Tax=Streptomyces sp. 604F TaxID=1476754 RepID=UPI00139719DB|nr:3-hydroxyacyl-CoA dehydrogenase [Streptomyces sp. 604F]MBP3076210.1 3-hydroxyacyl-CoA dehydrogenase [Streptomyces sp. 604F]QHV88526.1 3-hydroxyacyl-CoA dehydrogenase [Streptomyces sp. 604F]
MRIRVVGAGVMGRGIAQWAVTAGHTVELGDARRESVDEAVAFVRRMLDRAAEKGRLGRAEADDATRRLVPLDAPDAPGDGVEWVIEAVLEDLAVKTELFRRLEEVLPATAVLATNTSSLPVTRIAAGLREPERLIGLHFFNPVPLMKVVEVIPGARTRPGLAEELAETVRASGHAAVTVADTPGFLINHAGRGLVTEALALLEEQAAPAEAVDRIARDVLGLRMGPFELMDLTGLDVTSKVIDTIWEGFRYSERLRPSFLTPNRVAAGLHGRKTGEGFYRYGPDAPEPAGEPPVTGDARRAVRVAGTGPHARALREALAADGAALLTEGQDAPDALVLVPVWGHSVARAVAELGLPRGRSFGVDPLSADRPRRVLSVTPAADPVAARDARAVLASGGRTVTAVRDTAGSVAQRLLSSIVSVAASVAERGLARPADIDTAVTAGLGYPHGPLAWGDLVGADRLLDLQSALLAATGDPRHRPSRWVAERARLGMALTDPGTGPEAAYA